MEFLLINHPLDCPICDQGGECQLQDLAVGYGGSSIALRRAEARRVPQEPGSADLRRGDDALHPLHALRALRAGVAGVDGARHGRPQRARRDRVASSGRSVDSELSGNMIDLCPVGALTSKPFRYAARTWELSRRKSISPHDSLGSQSDRAGEEQPGDARSAARERGSQRVLAIRPDRFSYEGLNAPDRVLRPMLKQGGQWREVDWTVALEYVAQALTSVKTEKGAEAIGALASPTSTVEELYLLAKLMRGLGSDNIDFRLRQSDFTSTESAGVPWLGLKIADINKLDSVLLVGSFLRKDQPLVSARVRAATKRGCKVSVLHAVDDDLLMPVANKLITRPSAWVHALSEIAVAIAHEP